MRNASNFRWDEMPLPCSIAGFEDLAMLFCSEPSNRGLVRLDFDEAVALFKLIRALDAAGRRLRGAEIGRYHGGATVLLAAAMGLNGTLDSIDTQPQDDAAIAEVLSVLGLSEIVNLIVANALGYTVGAKYDFIFIDGDRTYESVRRNHNEWGRSVRTGGWIVHHDMASARPSATTLGEMERLRSDILARQRGILALTQEIGSLSVFRRTPGSWKDV